VKVRLGETGKQTPKRQPAALEHEFPVRFGDGEWQQMNRQQSNCKSRKGHAGPLAHQPAHLPAPRAPLRPAPRPPARLLPSHPPARPPALPPSTLPPACPPLLIADSEILEVIPYHSTASNRRAGGRVDVRACVRVCVRACVCACMHACMRVRVRVRACLHAGVHACVHACVRVRGGGAGRNSPPFVSAPRCSSVQLLFLSTGIRVSR
jgi:hypothetical protein